MALFKHYSWALLIFTLVSPVVAGEVRIANYLVWRSSFSDLSEFSDLGYSSHSVGTMNTLLLPAGNTHQIILSILPKNEDEDMTLHSFEQQGKMIFIGYSVWKSRSAPNDYSITFRNEFIKPLPHEVEHPWRVEESTP